MFFWLGPWSVLARLMLAAPLAYLTLLHLFDISNEEVLAVPLFALSLVTTMFLSPGVSAIDLAMVLASLVVGVFTASAPLGFALGQGLSPLVAARWGWPAIFLAFDGLAVLGLALFWPTSRGLGRAGGGTPTFSEFASVLRNRNVWVVGALGFLGYGLYLFVNSWGPSYLSSDLGLSLGLSGLVVALFPAIGVVGRAGGGVLSDWLFGGRRRPVMLAAFLIATPLLASFTLFRSVLTLVAVLLIAGVAIQLMIGIAFAYVRELVEPRVTATAVAYLTAVGLGGAFLSPIVGGAVIDAGGYRTAFLGAGVLSAAGIVLAWWAPEPG